MAKKSKRSNRRDNNPRIEKITTDALVGGRPAGFNPNYQHIIRDIRRVGILAGSFIVILIALSFFLH